MLQATDPPDEGTRALVSALYEVTSAARRSWHDDPIDGAGAAILFQVARHDCPRPSDLAAAARLDLSTVSRHVRALEQAGYLTRAADPSDGRAQQVALTDDGRAVLEQVFANRVATIAPVLSGWSDDDRRALGELLRRLADDLAASPTAAAPDHPRTDSPRTQESA